MSGSTQPFNNQRKQESLVAGQSFLLVCAVIAAAVFAFLYITDRENPRSAGGAPGPAQTTPPNQPPPPVEGIVSHEPTHIEVEQILLVKPAPGAPAEKVIVRTPAAYATGTLQWKAEQVEQARELQTRLANVLRHQAALERELARLEADWQRLVLEGLPIQALQPDSPSLPHLNPNPPTR